MSCSPLLGGLARALCILIVLTAGWRARADLWTTGYYPGYRQAYLPPSEIDFSALTHIIHFSVVPNTDGSLNTTANGLKPAYCTALVAAAHAAGTPALICAGGGGSEAGFQGATSAANRSTFINNLVGFMTTYGYDGIDIDWEPLTATDVNAFTNFINELRARLDTISPRPLLTVAVASQPALFASLQGQFDQVNLMTYDLAGPWPGWVTWFNSPVYDGGYRFPSTGGLIPSMEGMVTNFLGNGVTAAKLGIGVPFYGMIWSGGAGTSTGGAALPRQTWSTAPTTTASAYSALTSNYYTPNAYHWDNAAQAAYLSFDNSGSTNDKFISFDDEHSCQAKVSYARNRRLGGLIIWEIGQAYFASLPAGQRHPLLQAMKNARATPQFTAIQEDGSDIKLSFTTAPLGQYRLLCATNPATTNWAPLGGTLFGSGVLYQVTDPGIASTQSQRFYRIQTPP